MRGSVTVCSVSVTHDVDEAVLLSDRIVMMTNGPAATIGEIHAVDLPRPRDLEITYTKEFTDIVHELRGHIGAIRKQSAPVAQ